MRDLLQGLPLRGAHAGADPPGSPRRPCSLSDWDPVTLAAVAAILSAVALAACALPARRAARVDPMVSLRQS